MKIIISYASAGAGHFKAAEAIYNYIKGKNTDYDLSLIDILDKTPGLFRFFYKRGYSFMVRYAVYLWWFAFWVTEFRPLRFITRAIAKFLNKLSTASFAGDLIKENPDLIISTHFLPSEIAASLKKNNRIASKVVTVVTDFDVHPFWISPGTDFYVTASGLAGKTLAREGVNPEKIKEYGIPVDPKFLKNEDREEIKRNLGLVTDKFTVLLMTGSFGFGPLEEIVRVLSPEIQVIVVCASNERLYRRLISKDLPSVKVYGFVDNGQELMAASDVIITKPGGLSISEILCKELAPIFICVIPGQEAYNVRALSEYGVGVRPKSAEDIRRIIIDYRNNPEKLEAVRKNIRKVRKPDTLGEIYNAIRPGGPWSCS